MTSKIELGQEGCYLEYCCGDAEGVAMALMSRKVDYALLVLSYLHQNPVGKCARETADHFGLSRAFVANILKELCQNGFVASHRGARGGYVLHRPLEQLSLAELMEALDDSFHLAECTRTPPGEGCCFMNVCPVRDPVAEVHRRVADVLRGVTLADLFGAGLPPPNNPGMVELAMCSALQGDKPYGCGESE